MVGRTISMGLDVCSQKVMTYGLKVMSFPTSALHLVPYVL